MLTPACPSHQKVVTLVSIDVASRALHRSTTVYGANMAVGMQLHCIRSVAIQCTVRGSAMRSAINIDLLRQTDP